jgi:hypothetical protein
MEEEDYSLQRGIADELHWQQFVQGIGGGELVAPLIKRQGVKNADFMFRSARVIIELKVLETEFIETASSRQKIEAAFASHVGDDVEGQQSPLKQELLKIVKAPLQRIVNKANRQIKETKQELGLVGWRGIVVIVNDGFRGLPPGLVMGIIANILAGKSYSSCDAFIYQTSHYVELPDNPYAVLLWAPSYDDKAGDDLVDFVNDLGRKWRKFAEQEDGPYDYSGEQETTDLAKSLVVTGPTRSRRYNGDV